jgi:outer membrane biosynthesis protein TonB
MPAAEEPLRSQIDEAQQNLGSLEKELRAIDHELAGLASQREQHQLLAGVCESLEKLDELGAAEMFWGEHAAESKAAEYLGRARERVDVFSRQLGVIEDKRRSLLDGLKQGREVLDILEDDLEEIREAEERRLNEWVVERDISALPYRQQPMAWANAAEDTRRFRKAMALSIFGALMVATVVRLVVLPVPDPTEVIEVPERLARLIELEQRRSAPPPQPAPQEPEPLPEQVEPEPEVVAERPPPVDAPVVEEEGAPAPAVAQQEPPQQRAETAGILAFRESFSTMAARTPAARLGAQARIGNTGDPAIGPPERSMVTTQAPGSSGGINLASFSRELGGGGPGGGAIVGVEVGRVASSIGGPGGNGPGGSGLGDRASGGGAMAGRTDEEIQIVFDRYKAALYRLYNRELRNDPTLRGQMVLRLTIEPDGSVSMCQLQSTDMKAPALAAQVVERVKTFAFGAKAVPAITILYPIDFLPAG